MLREGFLPAYRGTLLLILQSHREFQVVTPRTLAAFHGAALVLPNVSEMDDVEKGLLRTFRERSGRLIVAGKDASGLCDASSDSCTMMSAPGDYVEELRRDFADGSGKMPKEFLEALRLKGAPEIEIEAPPTVAANFGRVNGAPHAFLANFGGLVPGKNLGALSATRDPHSNSREEWRFARLSSVSRRSSDVERSEARR